MAPHFVQQSYSVSSDAFTGGADTMELTGSTSEVSANAKPATALTAIMGSKSNPSEILTGGHGPAYDAGLTVSDTLIAGADIANFVQHSQSLYSETLTGGHGPHMGSNPTLSDALVLGAMANWVLQSNPKPSERLPLRTAPHFVQQSYSVSSDAFTTMVGAARLQQSRYAPSETFGSAITMF
jgi:hypothetical protein